jgi:hypothetical protein
MKGKVFHFCLALAAAFSTWAYATFKWTKVYFGKHLELEAIVFTLMLPKTGADQTFLYSYLKLMAWVIPLAAAVGWGYCRLLAKTSRPGAEPWRLPGRRSLGGPVHVTRGPHAEMGPGHCPGRWRPGVAWLLLVAAGLGYFAGAAYYLAHRKQVLAFFLNRQSREQTALYDDHYRAVRPEDVTFDTPPPPGSA